MKCLNFRIFTSNILEKKTFDKKEIIKILFEEFFFYYS